MIEINLPWAFNSKNMSVTQINLAELPYLKSTIKEPKMKKKDIIIRLEAAMEDKDWDAVQLLIEDLEYDLGFDPTLMGADYEDLEV